MARILEDSGAYLGQEEQEGVAEDGNPGQAPKDQFALGPQPLHDLYVRRGSALFSRSAVYRTVYPE